MGTEIDFDAVDFVEVDRIDSIGDKAEVDFVGSVYTRPYLITAEPL